VPSSPERIDNFELHPISYRCSKLASNRSFEMPKRPWLVESDKPSSYKVLKWIGGGGFGQVFKVLRDDQVYSV
jgi:hypothetical protein